MLHDEARRRREMQVSPKGNFIAFSALFAQDITEFKQKHHHHRAKKKLCAEKRFLALIKFCQTIKIIFSGKCEVEANETTAVERDSSEMRLRAK